MDPFGGKLGSEFTADSRGGASDQCPLAFPVGGVEIDLASAIGSLRYGSRSRWSATRRALAAMVSAGLVPPLEGKKELSTTYRLLMPWARL